MFSKLHNRLGTAGLVVAIVALVAALAGTAFAAAKLNGTQKKEVEKIAKKYAGKTGETGPTGSAGTNGAIGKDGAPGTPGINGTNGKTVLHGTTAPANSMGTEGDFYINTTTEEIFGPKGASTWPTPGTKLKGEDGTTGFTETLPSGKTETGVWGTGIATESTAGTRYFPISFMIPLEAAPTPIFVGPTEASKTGCPGRGGEPIGIPEAEPGNLCVYAGAFKEVNPTPSFFKPQFAAGAGTLSGGVGFTGTLLRVLCEEEECNANGTWAVTAE